MKAYVVEKLYVGETEIAGVYASLEAAMVAHPSPGDHLSDCVHGDLLADL